MNPVSKAEKEKLKLIQDKCQGILNDLLKDEDNKYCEDCDAKGKKSRWKYAPRYPLFFVNCIWQVLDGHLGTWVFFCASGARGFIETWECTSAK
jgi:hypothetical protein